MLNIGGTVIEAASNNRRNTGRSAGKMHIKIFNRVDATIGHHLFYFKSFSKK